jgi:hypothetical protein
MNGNIPVGAGADGLPFAEEDSVPDDKALAT